MVGGASTIRLNAATNIVAAKTAKVRDMSTVSFMMRRQMAYVHPFTAPNTINHTRCPPAHTRRACVARIPAGGATSTQANTETAAATGRTLPANGITSAFDRACKITVVANRTCRPQHSAKLAISSVKAQRPQEPPIPQTNRAAPRSPDAAGRCGRQGRRTIADRCATQRVTPRQDWGGLFRS